MQQLNVIKVFVKAPEGGKHEKVISSNPSSSKL